MIPIEAPFAAFESLLAPQTEGGSPITFENLQARIRGNILMALSNAYGWLVLTTGNKSEMSTGYCTLYGDMAGGFAVIRDVPKTHGLSPRGVSQPRRRAATSFPRSVIEKPPSAELKPDQKDTDSLPPYEQLDPILRAYVEEDRPVGEIVSHGQPRRNRRPGRPLGRPQRIQTPPIAPRRPRHQPRLRPRPKIADHKPLPRRARRAETVSRSGWPAFV